MLLMCLAVLGFAQLCFVRERLRTVPFNKDTRILTSKIKNAQTAGELLDVVDGIVDKPIFDHIHAAASYTKLGNFQKKRQLGQREMKSQVLVRLERRLEGMLARKEVRLRGLSNILWAAANLFSDMPAVMKIVPALVAQISLKGGDLDHQGLSNGLWAAAQLKDTAPDVLKLVAILSAQIPVKVGTMIPQELSNRVVVVVVCIKICI